MTPPPEYDPPPVTVVIPAWGAYAGQPLESAIRSLAAQSQQHAVIVVDNASSPPIPQGFAGGHVERLPDRLSTGAARNHGLGLVRSRFVVFLDADDELLPDSLAQLVRGAEAHPDASAYVMAIIDGDSGRKHRTPRRLARLLAGHPPAFALANATWSLLPTQGCTIIRSEVARAVGGYGDAYAGEDWVFGAALAFHGRVVFAEEPALCYHQHRDSPGVRSLPMRQLIANAGRVRERLLADATAPPWLRASLPLLAAAQGLAIVFVRPVARAMRPLLPWLARARRHGPDAADPCAKDRHVH